MPDITIAGASYPDVPAITVPKTGGGTATFPDVSPTTATAADVAQGKVFFAADGTQQTGTASGGGGASNFAKGTFTTPSTAGWQTISVPYTGSGYPVSLMIYPADGVADPDSPIYTLLQRYAFVVAFAAKNVYDAVPSYSGSTDDQFFLLVRYKSNASNAQTQSSSANTAAAILGETAASPTQIQQMVRMPDKSTLKVYVAGTSYGLANGIKYAYEIAYSS